MPFSTPRIALVGDRSAGVLAHTRIPALLDALARRDQLVLDAYWIPTPDAEATEALAGFDAVWLVPGSPYRSEAGALAAVRTAREQGIPFLGTCGGFQHALLEFARNVCGLAGVSHAENHPEADDLLIVPLTCSLRGHEGAVQVAAGSLAERVLGAERTVERYSCSYGPSPSYLDALRAHGLRFSGVDVSGVDVSGVDESGVDESDVDESGVDESGGRGKGAGTSEVRMAELPGHPFFLATLFQPELAGDGTRPHPVIRALAAAAVDHAATKPV
ncbi:glutamine amidotransferase-related protein [Streptomyces sclerotialus]|uniref:glutamine amidotransferase-related protein n=1 Tax=Streptomyces sclerotialus TaxID=1957 RepID=UPI00056178A8